MPMKIYIFHYHLHPGGVTRIIQSQVKAIKKIIPDARLHIICGWCPDISYYVNEGIEISIFEQLDYLSNQVKEKEMFVLERKITQFFKSLIKREDIIHFHNMNLGKNPVVTFVMYKLVMEGYRVFNHAHDFSEDRPLNWEFLSRIISGYFGEPLKKVMYPNVSNYKLGILNSFDFRRLKDYGIPVERLFLLPNPVDIGEIKIITKESAKEQVFNKLPLDPLKKNITYPVRVIERKNIAEFIILCVLFSGEANWIVTLPPKNPVEVETYEKWKKFCTDNKIPVFFEAGLQVDYSLLINASDYCISTSMREGFGMAFMEPWLFKTPVIGRSIPYIKVDLEKEGMLLDGLYNQLLVDWNGMKKDFIHFSREEKENIILNVINGEKKKEIVKLNPWLNGLLKNIKEEELEHNYRVIKDKFNLINYGKRLLNVYESFN